MLTMLDKKKLEKEFKAAATDEEREKELKDWQTIDLEEWEEKP